MTTKVNEIKSQLSFLFLSLQVIHLHFTHFELGLQSADPCKDTDDRLVVTERGGNPYCILPNTQKIVTKSNEVAVAFYSNSEVDAQGFRAFYSAGKAGNREKG